MNKEIRMGEYGDFPQSFVKKQGSAEITERMRFRERKFGDIS